MSVKPIPEGAHTLTPYFNVKGADQAIELYKKAFGAEELVRMPGPDGKIMHAELRIGDSRLFLSEAQKDSPTVSGIQIYVADCDLAFKRALEAGMTVKMPLADMFWGDRMGAVSDRFGNSWSIGTHKEDVSPADMKQRMATFFASAKK